MYSCFKSSGSQSHPTKHAIGFSIKFKFLPCGANFSPMQILNKDSAFSHATPLVFVLDCAQKLEALRPATQDVRNSNHWCCLHRVGGTGHPRAWCYCRPRHCSYQSGAVPHNEPQHPCSFRHQSRAAVARGGFRPIARASLDPLPSCSSAHTPMLQGWEHRLRKWLTTWHLSFASTLRS